MSKPEPYVVTVNSNGTMIEYDSVSMSNWERVEGEKALSHSFHRDTLRKIMGKMLTIADACVIDKQQNKAMKDLIRAAISEEMEFGAEMAYDQEKLQALIPENILSGPPVSIEEALGVNN